MYLVPIHVPLYVGGEGASRVYVTTEWKRSLVLLRDSLRGRFGPVGVVAPSLPTSEARSQRLEEIRDGEGIVARASFDARVRARGYWLTERKRWMRDVREMAERSRVVHAGMDDVYRPITFDAFRVGLGLWKPTVFVQDTDVVLQMNELAAGKGMGARARAAVYTRLFDMGMNFGVEHATLTLLKGGSLRRRYEGRAANLKVFEDTSYSTSEIVPREEIGRRVAGLGGREGLRLVYCGRLEARKGVDHSIRAVAHAKGLGASVSFDVIGDGEQRGACEALAKELGAPVRFMGKRDYGAGLLRELAGYDGLLFTPLAEDTPRMIFDGYAAGLPLIAYEIDYTRERERGEGCVVISARGDWRALGERLAKLATPEGKQELASLTERAADAAPMHAADVWYSRRAAWTIEAVERFESGEGKMVKGK